MSLPDYLHTDFCSRTVGFAGRIIGISLAGSVFENMLQRNLAAYAPDLPAPLVQAVVNSAAAVWDSVPANLQESVLIAYIESLRDVYVMGIPFGICGALAALLIKNSKMQTKAEELAAIEAAKEHAALEAKEKGQTDSQAEAAAEEAAEHERLEQVASRLGAVQADPDVAVEAGRGIDVAVEEERATGGQVGLERELDAQAVLAEKEGGSAV